MPWRNQWYTEKYATAKSMAYKKYAMEKSMVYRKVCHGKVYGIKRIEKLNTRRVQAGQGRYKWEFAMLLKKYKC